MPKSKVRRWTEDEDYLLENRAAEMTVPELMKIIDASSTQIRYRCKQLGIMPKSVYKTWTFQELEIARSNPRKVASKMLDRNENSINSRIQYAKKQNAHT